MKDVITVDCFLQDKLLGTAHVTREDLAKANLDLLKLSMRRLTASSIFYPERLLRLIIARIITAMKMIPDYDNGYGHIGTQGRAPIDLSYWCSDSEPCGNHIQKYGFDDPYYMVSNVHAVQGLFTFKFKVNIPEPFKMMFEETEDYECTVYKVNDCDEWCAIAKAKGVSSFYNNKEFYGKDQYEVFNEAITWVKNFVKSEREVEAKKAEKKKQYEIDKANLKSRQDTKNVFAFHNEFMRLISKYGGLLDAIETNDGDWIPTIKFGRHTYKYPCGDACNTPNLECNNPLDEIFDDYEKWDPSNVEFLDYEK